MSDATLKWLLSWLRFCSLSFLWYQTYQISLSLNIMKWKAYTLYIIVCINACWCVFLLLPKEAFKEVNNTYSSQNDRKDRKISETPKHLSKSFLPTSRLSTTSKRNDNKNLTNRNNPKWSTLGNKKNIEINLFAPVDGFYW